MTKDNFWMMFTAMMFCAVFIALGIIMLDRRDAERERNLLHTKFIQKCEKNYPLYRCNILWDSYMEELRSGTP